MKKIRILVADDHSVVRMGIVALLETVKDMAVVGEADDGAAAVRVALGEKPDVVLMDLMMPRMNGVEAIASIRAALPFCRFVVLTTFATPDVLLQAQAAGAEGLMFKSASNDSLISAIRRVAEGGRVVPPDVRRILAECPAVPDLSPRQREILVSLVRGLTNHDISVQLGIGADSVKEHVNAICRKLNAANRTEAVSIALRKYPSLCRP